MGVMAKEIKKLKGRSAYLNKQSQLDALSEAQNFRKVEDLNQTYLRQLYYGLETLIDRVTYQEDMIRELVESVGSRSELRRVKYKVQKASKVVKQSKATKAKALEQPETIINTVDELEQATRLIDSYIDEKGRIPWRKVEDPKALVFAYMRKAESEGLNIESTMDMQSQPQYRRVFQYVAYNIGKWKHIVEEYKDIQKAS